jgi:hypothetical protein
MSPRGHDLRTHSATDASNTLANARHSPGLTMVGPSAAVNGSWCVGVPAFALAGASARPMKSSSICLEQVRDRVVGS